MWPAAYFSKAYWSASYWPPAYGAAVLPTIRMACASISIVPSIDVDPIVSEGLTVPMTSIYVSSYRVRPVRSIYRVRPVHAGPFASVPLRSGVALIPSVGGDANIDPSITGSPNIGEC